MKRRPSKDWKGGKFVLVSVSVTVALVLFFFAGRQFLHTMNQIVASWDAGGWTISQTALNIEQDSNACCQNRFVTRLEKQVSSYKGRWFFQADPQVIANDLQRNPFVDQLQVRRSYQGRLEVTVKLLRPAMLVRGQEAWLVVNEEGKFLSVVKALREDFWTLPMVFGLEDKLHGDTERLNHYLVREGKWLASLYRLRTQLRDRLQIEVQNWQLREDPWAAEAFVVADWNSLKIELPLKLSEEGMRSLQFILSDLKARSEHSGYLRGRFGKKWFFNKEREEI